MRILTSVRFVELKSVDLLKKWLEDAKEKDKAEVMENVMKVIMKLPLTVEVLTSSGIGKLVAQLKKDTSLNEGKYFFGSWCLSACSSHLGQNEGIKSNFQRIERISSTQISICHGM